MDKSKLVRIGVLTLAAILLCVVLWIIAIMGGMDLTDGCLYRYNLASDGSVSSSDKLTDTITLKANANYKALSSETTGRAAELDPTTYGKWLNTNLRLTADQKVTFSIKGELSLCKAYVTSYNLESESNLNISNELIAIPRVEDVASIPATLIFNAKTGEWRNLTQVFKNDKILVTLQKEIKTSSPSSSVYSSIKKGNVSDDCREWKRDYNPICGRYSIYSGDYVDSCRWEPNCKQVESGGKCYTNTAERYLLTHDNSTTCQFWGGVWAPNYRWDGCYKEVYLPAPVPYRNDEYTSPWFEDINSLITNFAPECGNGGDEYVNGDYQSKKYFWYSADNATGLLYRFDSNLNPTSKYSRGSNYSFAAIETEQSDLTGLTSEQIIMNTDTANKAGYIQYDSTSEQIIMNRIYTDNDVRYLQYRFHDQDGAFGDNTGGYVLKVKQTKCRRANGNAFNDTLEGRGAVQYIIADYGKNPNNDMSGLTIGNILADASGSGSLTASANNQGYLWMKIRNNPDDYKDSFGQYQVQFFTEVKKGSFYNDVLGPFFEGFKGKIKGASITVFKNMTCYQGLGGAGNCTNFFTYIKAILILYIMTFGMMFLLGMVKINQTDLIVRIVKIAFVSGLMNDSTFEFFNNYVFNFTTEFSDTIIANMSGYSLFSGSTTLSNPMMFMNEVMTKIFLSSTFAAQIMSLPSMGLNGILYFILMIVCIGIIVIVLFRAIAVYLMAYMAIAVLIGIAPLFLTFILFEKTRHLFDNWVKFTFRYMLEPVIMLAGIIILTQLFTIYLDYVIGYSVCWKCAIPIKIPFPSIPGIDAAFLDVELFCFNWFAPWGFDHRSSQMGLNMQNMVVLLMIAYCLWGYIDFSGKIVGRIAGGVGGPSATGIGGSMSGAAENSALKKIGLDAESRNTMKELAEERLGALRRGDKKESSESGNRHDAERGSEKPNSSPPTDSKEPVSPAHKKAVPFAHVTQKNPGNLSEPEIPATRARSINPVEEPMNVFEIPATRGRSIEGAEKPSPEDEIPATRGRSIEGAEKPLTEAEINQTRRSANSAEKPLDESEIQTRTRSANVAESSSTMPKLGNDKKDNE